VEPPGVGGVTADSCCPIERRPLLGPVVRLPLEVRLFATEPVAKRRGRRRPGPAGVFPLLFGRQPDLPVLRKDAGPAASFGELLAECLRLRKVDVPNREVIPRGQLRRQLARQLPDDPFPLTLRDLVLGDPEASGEGHLDLIFPRSPFRFAGWASHDEAAGRTPAELDALDFTLLASARSAEGRARLLGQQ